MKKKLLIAGITLFGIFIIILIVGVIFGNVTFGHQKNELRVTQKSKIEESAFSKIYLTSEKVICLNLWATWCVPCVEEMPILNKIKEDYKSKNVEFISMSVDTDSTRLSKFIRSNKFHFIDITFENLPYKNSILNYLENRPLDESVNMHSVPVTYIIKNKKVIKKFDGTVERNEVVIEINKALE